MRRGNCGAVIGVCALGLGLGILIAAIFPVGALMFLVAFLLIACGPRSGTRCSQQSPIWVRRPCSWWRRS